MTALSRAEIALARAVPIAALIKSCKFSSSNSTNKSYFSALTIATFPHLAGSTGWLALITQVSLSDSQ